MLTIENEQMKFPIKAWLKDAGQADGTCLEQAARLAGLPFLHKWVCLMPDAHAGMGMPIGGVIATKGVIIPNAVGVDIGCGMAYAGTDVRVDEIKNISVGNGSFIQALVGNILRDVPVGFNRHKTKQACAALDKANAEMDKYAKNPGLAEQIEAGYYQAGTLGGGNHFIEIQQSDDGYLGIMIHSGSRNFGKQICDYYHKAARALNERWYAPVPDEWQLAFLPTDSEEGRQYIDWMNLALEFAYENRALMLKAVKDIFDRMMKKYADADYRYTDEINCHHNYAAIERHYDANVWVHRKGATRARAGERAVIPGAMGSFSYVVEGLGNAESFCSSSHGAGRQYSRKAAMENFSTERVMLDLKEQGVVLGKADKSDVAEESRFAYKNIDEVMDNQRDLVKAVTRLKTVGVVKG
ncbi:MAG: RtcB family protein [Clostridiales bacterium]|jgi:tRNA-splicing ligase RtcB|nr:RtcB family protein [Clostridiales bacterium]